MCRDREKRQPRPPKRFGYEPLTAYALNIALIFKHGEANTYQEAIASKQHFGRRREIKRKILLGLRHDWLQRVIHRENELILMRFSPH